MSISMKRFQILFLRVFPYVLGFAAILAIMVIGTRTTVEDGNVPIALSYEDPGFSVTSDQVSEYYTVANIANTISLPSTSSISENYVTVNSLYKTTGALATSTLVPDKPTVIDVSDQNRGIITYTVQAGDTADSIATAFGITKDQLRWSNGKKKESDIVEGDVLSIPSVAGIVYSVKDGETIDSLAEKYGSNRDEIIAFNDLEGKEISKDMKIILPNGTLPEKERPEYVAPVVVASGTRYTYSNYSSGNRHNLTEVGSYGYWDSVYYQLAWQHNPGAYGNCTWYAWYWRRNNMPENYWLPTGAIGNAGDWIYTLSGSYGTGRTPEYGAVIQSTAGYYGHVGVVVGVNPGESITIEEMNYPGPAGMFNHVYRSNLTWNDALTFNYIYAHY